MQEYPYVLQDLYRERTYQIQDYSETGVPVGTTELNQGQELIRDKSTRRYYRTKSDAGVPVGTTELKQIQEYP